MLRPAYNVGGAFADDLGGGYANETPYPVGVSRMAVIQDDNCVCMRH